MSMNFFNDVLTALGRKLNYESISNLYGNSFAKNAAKHINEAFPLSKLKKFNKGFTDIINKSVSKSIGTKEQKNAQAKKTLGNTDWATGLFD